MTPVDGCRFCAIVAGQEPAHVVFEDEISIAFLDHRPLFPGHSLLVPREHYETIWDLPDELVGPLFANAKSLSEAIRTAMGSQGAFIALNNVVSQSVPHLHIHVMPRVKGDDVNLNWQPKPGDMAAIKAIYEKLKAAL